VSHRPGLALLFLICISAPATPELDDTEMPVVLVTGERSGPAMWKVSSGDHVLWMLGEISPYPRKVKWRSKEFERLLRDSQELLIDFSGYWMMDDEQAAALDRASRLPPGTTLKDVIEPELHARVEATAGLFGNPPLSELRPFAATNRLVSSAMHTLDMEGFSVRFAAAKQAEWRGKKVTYFAVPEIAFAKRLQHWQQALNEVCLKRLVDVIEDGGRGVQQMANAWSIGDIEALRLLAPRYSFSRDGFRAAECAAAMHGGEKQADEYRVRRNKAWLDEAERALDKNRSTIAVVLMSELFEPDGYLAALRARGYEIVEPQ
jgi:uncharacterized protein YbaP (TraB family)